MDELWRDVDLERAHLDRLVDDELEEELVNTLQVRPGGVHLLLLIDTCLCKVQIALLDVWEWAEDVFLDHLHHFVKVWDDHAHHIFLVLEHGLKLSDGVESLSLQ